MKLTEANRRSSEGSAFQRFGLDLGFVVNSATEVPNQTLRPLRRSASEQRRLDAELRYDLKREFRKIGERSLWGELQASEE